MYSISSHILFPPAPPPHWPQPLYDIGFLGQGYVELESHELNQHSSFGFTFQTMESDALLMISTFVGQVWKPSRAGVVFCLPIWGSHTLVISQLGLRSPSAKNCSTWLNRRRIWSIIVNLLIFFVDFNNVSNCMSADLLHHLRTSVCCWCLTLTRFFQTHSVQQDLFPL